jgi:iron complex transport system substrate-binding protein
MTSRYHIFLLLLVLAVLASGCTSSVPTKNSTAQADSTYTSLTVADDAGRIMTFTEPPRRIVSLSPSGTEILYALGLGDRLVGADVYSNYPPEAAALPPMGGMITVSVENVTTAKPDLVLAGPFTPAETVNELAGRGLMVYVSSPGNASSTGRAVMAIGDICGVPARAGQLRDRMSADVAAVANETSRLDAGRIPKVLMIITLGNECYVADPGGYMDDLIRIGGGRNIATAPAMTPEQIAQASPDLIIVPLTYWTIDTFESLRYAKEPWMRDLAAVRAGRVYAVDYDVVGRPGPRIGYAAAIMARAIHPELFR